MTLTPPLIQGASPPTLPAPKPPGIDLVTGSSGASQPGAIYAGTDSSGNSVYAVPQDPNQTITDTQQALSAWYTAQAANNPAVDCSSFMNQLQNPAVCGWTTLGLVAGGLLLLVVMMVKK